MGTGLTAVALPEKYTAARLRVALAAALPALPGLRMFNSRSRVVSASRFQAQGTMCFRFGRGLLRVGTGRGWPMVA